jgi:hypothetical protein
MLEETPKKMFENLNGYNYTTTGFIYKTQERNETQEPFESNFCPIFANYYRYYLIFIVLIGLIGNSLIIIVFLRSKFSYYNRTKFYLICLAISDSIYLIVLFFVWLESMDLLLFLGYNYICQLSVYTSYISSFMSTQLVVAFTLQRLFSICFPLKNNTLEKKSKLIVTSLILFACVFYNYAIWAYNANISPSKDLDNSMVRCKAKKEYVYLVEELDLADSLFTLIIPFIGISVMNVIIVRSLRRSNIDFIVFKKNNNQNGKQLRNHVDYHSLGGINLKKEKQAIVRYKKVEKEPRVRSASANVLSDGNKMKNNEKIDSNPVLNHHIKMKPSTKRLCSLLSKRQSVFFRKNTENSITSGSIFNSSNTSMSLKVTKMLICVSTVFLLLNLPFHSFKLYLYVRVRKTGEEYSGAESCIYDFFQNIFYASFSCNFFLYSISGSVFRNEFKSFISSIIKKKVGN